jgi:hypothetical protein
VLAYAKQELKLPLDITVNPGAPNDVPLALGENGRCKLVLSMRGNPNAEDILNNVPAAQRPLMIEAMVAHEIGHCWRYVQGEWHVVPSGFEESQQQPAALRDAARGRLCRPGGAGVDAAAPSGSVRHRGALDAARCARRRLPRFAQHAGGCNWRRPARPSTPAAVFEQADRLWRQGLLLDR